jgi:hypothetical protein
MKLQWEGHFESRDLPGRKCARPVFLKKSKKIFCGLNDKR